MTEKKLKANVPFEDFTIEERKLFWDVLKRPFDDWQIVLRWAVSAASFEFMQSMPPDDVARVAALRYDPDARLIADAQKPYREGTEVPENYSWDATTEGVAKALRKEGKMTEDLEYLLLLRNISHDNAVLWIWEVASQQENLQPLDLRREVCRQLQAEISAAGDCSVWLSFMAWIVRRREPGRQESWQQWIQTESGDTALAAGLAAFTEWREARRPVEEELAGNQPREPAAPLEQADQDLTVVNPDES